jgi:hypothetical protein
MAAAFGWGGGNPRGGGFLGGGTVPVPTTAPLDPRDPPLADYDLLKEELRIEGQQQQQLMPGIHQFANAHDDSGGLLMPALHRRMHAMACTLRAKQHWWRKVFDETIVATWRLEAMAQGFTSPAFDLIVDELRWHARRIPADSPECGPRPSSVSGAWVADGAVPERVRVGLVERLDALLAAQRESPEGIDYHPGSNEQVRNFFHPSLHAVYGGRARTIVDDITERVAQETKARGGLPLQGTPVDDMTEFDETNFARVAHAAVSQPALGFGGGRGGGGGVRAGFGRGRWGGATAEEESTEAEEVIPAAKAFDPHRSHRGRWSRTVMPQKSDSGGDQSPDNDAACTGLGIRDYDLGAFGSLATVSTTTQRGYEETSTFQWLPSEVAIGLDGTATFTSAIPGLHAADHAGIYAALQKVLACALPSLEMVLTDLAFRIQNEVIAQQHEYTFMQTRKVVVRDTRVVIQISGEILGQISVTPARTFIPPIPADAACASLRGRRLQVIAKASQIHLKPGERYAGGSWHVEGSPNECIVATIIYYADQVNVTASSLSFCAPVCEDTFDMLNIPFKKSDAVVTFVDKVFGIHGEADIPPEAWGQVATSSGRSIGIPEHAAAQAGAFRAGGPVAAGVAHDRRLLRGGPTPACAVDGAGAGAGRGDAAGGTGAAVGEAAATALPRDRDGVRLPRVGPWADGCAAAAAGADAGARTCASAADARRGYDGSSHELRHVRALRHAQPRNKAQKRRCRCAIRSRALDVHQSHLVKKAVMRVRTGVLVSVARQRALIRKI